MAYTEKKRSMFLGLPWTFTTYKITEELITVKEGLLRKTENDCYMYKIQDVELQRGFFQRHQRIFSGQGYPHAACGTVKRLLFTQCRNKKAYLLMYNEAE